MIPKIIHYCWFGGKRKPKLICDCIKSWKTHLYDYEIIEWNEKNCDLSHPFVQEVHRLKKWAFVADYIRLQKLYEHGGIYLDTDMMVLKSFNYLLDTICFFGAEDNNYVSCGVIGAVYKNKLILDCLSQYESIQISLNQNWDLVAMPILVSRQIRKFFNFNEDFGIRLNFDGAVIYETDFFYPLPNKFKSDRVNYINYITSQTIAVHLWSASWVDYDEFYYIKNKLFKKALFQIFKKLFLKNEFSFQYLKKIFKEIYNLK